MATKTTVVPTKTVLSIRSGRMYICSGGLPARLMKLVKPEIVAQSEPFRTFVWAGGRLRRRLN
jgi:hypothetical protein